MRIVVVAALTILAFLQVAGTQVAAQEPAEPLLADIVSLFFPGYIVVSPGDLNPAIVRRAAADPAYDGAGRTPTVIRADLDGNGVADYAILVREDRDDQSDEVFAVLMGQGGGRYSRAVEAFFGPLQGSVYLGYAPAGSVLTPAPQSDLLNEPIELVLPAVKLIRDDGRVDAFFWITGEGYLASMPTVQ